MKKYLYIVLIAPIFTMAQVGINTTNPAAQLEIKSSNQATPSNTDGILIPKIDAFPATNPTIAQQGMLVYLTTTSGTDLPGFYFWDNATVDWKPIAGASLGTLDQAYDFGGAGNGKTITADAGAVTINGTDGLVSTGTFGSGAIVPTVSGLPAMIWNPKKAAFRAGIVGTFEWDDSNVGDYSVAFGEGNMASGNYSSAFGAASYASGHLSFAAGWLLRAQGLGSTALGFSSSAYGDYSTAFGFMNTAFSEYSTSFGRRNDAYGQSSIAFGYDNEAKSYGETVFGIGATNYTESPSGSAFFRPFNATDRLVVVGNAIDSNNNSTVDTAERSDALIILKNGLTRLPSTTNAMITAADGKAVVTKEYLQSNTSGTLDQAYDFGGAGAGRTITADTGAVTINGTDGFISTGTISNGAIVPSGSGVRMVWNPRKAAFRAGSPFSTEWDDANVGINSAAFGFANTASGAQSTAFGSTNFATGHSSTAFGGGVIASGLVSTAFGSGTNASGRNSTAFGFHAIASGDYATAYGNENAAFSFGETTLGIGATTYLPSTNGATQFRAANAVDRLFVIGNAIDLNNNDSVDPIEKRDALIILKNGLTRLPSTTNAMITAADGKAVVTKEWIQGNGWGVIGNAGINDAVNFIGTTNDADVVFKRNNIEAGRLDAMNTSMGLNAMVGNTTGTLNTAFGNNSLQVNTIGASNSAFGFESLKFNTMGYNNSAFGSYSLTTNSLGQFNSAFGKNTLLVNTFGSFNCAFGAGALSSNIIGNANAAYGAYSLYSNITGIYNSSFGDQSMFENTTGNENSAFGKDALKSLTTGSTNTAIGYQSLENATTGSNNTAIGNNTLGAITSGSFNTAIGAEANTNSTIYTNATAIGSKAMAGNSNTVILGSIDGVNGATSSVNVGIGTVNPNSALEIVEANVVTAGTVEGNLNIATNNPQNIDIGASITLSGIASSGSQRVFASVEGRKSNAGSASDSGYLSFKTNSVGTLAERMRITNVGDVGIGTPAPGGQFELSLNEGRKPTSNTWTIPSDARLKNVNGVYQKGLAEIVQLKPIRYNYKNTDNKNFDQRVLDKEAYGFLAQEVQPLFPEAVGIDTDGYLNFDLHPILIASINALKELNEKNTQLESENEQLKVAMKQMEQNIATILTEVENLKR